MQKGQSQRQNVNRKAIKKSTLTATGDGLAARGTRNEHTHDLLIVIQGEVLSLQQHSNRQSHKEAQGDNRFACAAHSPAIGESPL